MANQNPNHMPRVAITIDRRRLDAIDRIAHEREIGRSRAIRDAIDVFLRLNTSIADTSSPRIGDQEAA